MKNSNSNHKANIFFHFPHVSVFFTLQFKSTQKNKQIKMLVINYIFFKKLSRKESTQRMLNNVAMKHKYMPRFFHFQDAFSVQWALFVSLCLSSIAIKC